MNEDIKDIFSNLPYLEMGSGFLIGLSIGYVLKKSFKIMLFLLGLTVILLFVLENQHIITIDEKSLEQSVSHWSESFKYFVIFLQERVTRLHTTGTLSAGAGFLLGLKVG